MNSTGEQRSISNADKSFVKNSFVPASFDTPIFYTHEKTLLELVKLYLQIIVQDLLLNFVSF